jgi:mitotic spindle assembly checkpoint protein MAD2
MLKTYHITEWLLTGSVTQLVLAIISKDTRTPLERWVFDIKLVEPPAESEERYDYSSIFLPSQIKGGNSRAPKPESEIQSEIRAILKQIISMVTYLPVIQEPTVFNILAYTSDSADVPAGEWVDTDPLAIEASKSQQVKMRGFSTDVHRIEAMVAYRYEE